MDQHATTISELESGLQRSLAALRELAERGELHEELKPLLALAPPEGASVHVSLRQRDTGRPLRGASPSHAWRPQTCGVWVIYEAAQGLRLREQRSNDGSGDPLQDFIAALDQVERDPHLHFVSLKWFRDTYLTKLGYEWATDPDRPRRMIHETTEAGMILTSKVPNPKTPEFPVTTIHLNRSHPKVRAILESIAPIPSKGDAESAAVVPEVPSGAAAPPGSGGDDSRAEPVQA